MFFNHVVLPEMVSKLEIDVNAGCLQSNPPWYYCNISLLNGKKVSEWIFEPNIDSLAQMIPQHKIQPHWQLEHYHSKTLANTISAARILTSLFYPKEISRTPCFSTEKGFIAWIKGVRFALSVLKTRLIG